LQVGAADVLDDVWAHEIFPPGKRS
jgi:hypothetical protein